MRRSLCLLAFLAPIAIAPIAFGQDTQADGGAAPLPTVTATATTPAPTVVVQTPPAPAVLVKTSDEQEPLHLGRFLQLEADRARSQRYGSAALQMVGGAVDIGLGIAAFAYVNSNSTSLSGSDQVIVTALSIIPIALGGGILLGGLFSLFSTTPMERLLEVYAPIAIDRSLSPTARVARGEGLLFAAADAERGRRTVNAVSSFIVAAVGIGFAIGFGADTNDFPTPTNVLLATSFAGMAVIEVLAGIGSLWWERGPAEVAWDQWHALHEPVVVQTSRIHITPTFSPLPGGATGGVLLRF